jgi:hypothetical protein
VAHPADIDKCQVTVFGPLGHKGSEELVLTPHSFAQHEWIDGTMTTDWSMSSCAIHLFVLLSSNVYLQKGRLRRISTLRAIPIQLAHAQTIAISQVISSSAHCLIGLRGITECSICLFHRLTPLQGTEISGKLSLHFPQHGTSKTWSDYCQPLSLP